MRLDLNQPWKKEILKIRKKCCILYHVVYKVGTNMALLCLYTCVCTPPCTHLHTHEHWGARHRPIPFYRWRNRLKVWEFPMEVTWFNMELSVAALASIFSLHCRLIYVEGNYSLRAIIHGGWGPSLIFSHFFVPCFIAMHPLPPMCRAL